MIAASPMRLAASARIFRTQGRRIVDCAIILGLALLSHSVYRASTGVVQMCDSTYSLVVCEQLLREGTFDLRSCIPADDRIRSLPGYQEPHGLPYQLVRRPDPRDPDGPPRFYYGYPLGSSVLSLPFVMNYRSRGLSCLGPDGIPVYQIEGARQAKIAAWVCSAIVGIFYLIARGFCSPALAALLAAGFAFGSPVWSTLSRSLWSHTWMVFWVSVAVAMVVAMRQKEGRTGKSDVAWGIGLGTAMFWAVFCRQHAVVSAGAIGVYLVCQGERRVLAFTVLSGVIWVASLVSVSLAWFGTPLPPSVYSAGMIDGRDMASRFAWLMISPARGLLIYCPYLLAAAAILLCFRGRLKEAGLLLPAGMAVAGQTLLLCSYDGWHGNWAYGPRYFADVLPWFALTCAMAFGALANSPSRWGKAIGSIVLTATFAWGVFVHERGANSREAWMWNDLTRTLGNEGAVKDWRYPQFLAGITFIVNADGTVRE